MLVVRRAGPPSHKATDGQAPIAIGACFGIRVKDNLKRFDIPLDKVYVMVYTYSGREDAMDRTIALKELRPDLPKVADAIEEKLDRYIVTRHGKPVMMIINPEDYEGLLETIEILQDRSALRRIRKARKEARGGKTISLEALRKRLEHA